MSTTYKRSEDVPNSVLADRLKELVNALVEHSQQLGSEFSMRVPIELDRDADVVMEEAALRLRSIDKLRSELERYKKDGCQKTIPKAPTFGQEKEWQTHEDFRKSVKAMADQLCFVDIYEENIDDLVVVLHLMGYTKLGE